MRKATQMVLLWARHLVTKAPPRVSHLAHRTAGQKEMRLALQMAVLMDDQTECWTVAQTALWTGDCSGLQRVAPSALLWARRWEHWAPRRAMHWARQTAVQKEPRSLQNACCSGPSSHTTCTEHRSHTLLTARQTSGPSHSAIRPGASRRRAVPSGSSHKGTTQSRSLRQGNIDHQFARHSQKLQQTQSQSRSAKSPHAKTAARRRPCGRGCSRPKSRSWCCSRPRTPAQ